MSTQPPNPAEPTRIERMVGELIALRMLITELLSGETAEAQALRERVRAGALSGLEKWQIGSDTPEGADRIRAYAQRMLRDFPEPVPVVGHIDASRADAPAA